jgi:ParB family transcriptional regulator, chromosome partitioning protein
MPLQLDDLAALDAPTLSTNGQPLMLPVAAIDEDPEQPRHEFDANALQDLADTIRERGVRQPISVRPNLQQAGRWVLNFGARRLRASRLAGLPEVPAFVDTTADSYDQVIENEQREGLKPLELALFVQKRLALGDKQAEIAKRLGKSRQWVTLATALIEAPDWLLQAYREGRCRGMNELYEVRRLHGEHGQVVEAWVAGQVAITRDRIASLRAELIPVDRQSFDPTEGLAERGDEPTTTVPSERGQAQPNFGTVGSTDSGRGHEPQLDQNARSGQRIHVEFDGQDYQLVVSVAPEQGGCMYVRPLTGGPRRLAPVSSLKLLGFVGA